MRVRASKRAGNGAGAAAPQQRHLPQGLRRATSGFCMRGWVHTERRPAVRCAHHGSAAASFACAGGRGCPGQAEQRQRASLGRAIGTLRLPAALAAWTPSAPLASAHDSAHCPPPRLRLGSRAPPALPALNALLLLTFAYGTGASPGVAGQGHTTQPVCASLCMPAASTASSPARTARSRASKRRSWSWPAGSTPAARWPTRPRSPASKRCVPPAFQSTRPVASDPIPFLVILMRSDAPPHASRPVRLARTRARGVRSQRPRKCRERVCRPDGAPRSPLPRRRRSGWRSRSWCSRARAPWKTSRRSTPPPSCRRRRPRSPARAPAAAAAASRRRRRAT